MTSLRAFEAVARHRNVSAAAKELFVTQPAVSQQIRHLEANLGVALTVRLNRGVELTREGEVLAARLTRGFAEIRAGVEIARSVGRRDLSVSVALLATFAQRWLIHRLASFQESFPDIAIRLIAATSLEDLDNSDADILIRCGTPRAGGLVADRLIANQFFPVASPALLDTQPLATPQDLRNHILIRVEAEPRHMDWPVWFQNAQAANIQPRDWIAMSNSSHAIEAAIAGLGVAIAHTPFVSDSLATGRLVAPLQPMVDGDEGDYFVVAEKDRAPHVDIFRKWLLTEARSDHSNSIAEPAC